MAMLIQRRGRTQAGLACQVGGAGPLSERRKLGWDYSGRSMSLRAHRATAVCGRKRSGSAGAATSAASTSSCDSPRDGAPPQTPRSHSRHSYRQCGPLLVEAVPDGPRTVEVSHRPRRRQCNVISGGQFRRTGRTLDPAPTEV
jgi:hypothetical protein